MVGEPNSHLTLFWRPGCRYCTKLRKGLDRLAITRVEINIWEDPAGAATVREIANGDETVPTVVINGVGYVNPTVDEVARLLHNQLDSSV
jgi:glutaredoxin